MIAIEQPMQKATAMSVKTYEGHLLERFKFFNSSLRRTRTDSEHPWVMEKNNKVGLGVFLAQFPQVRNLVRGLSNKSPVYPVEVYIRSHIEQLFEVRSLLEDQLSKLLFDDAIILRALSPGKFYYPRIDFDAMAEVTSEAPFNEAGFPDHYLQLPLKKLGINLKTKAGDRPINLITSQEAIKLLNTFRQYFIRRDNLDFRPAAGDIIFDCGACIGDTSLIFSGLCGESGEVHAFDPIPLHIRFGKLQGTMNPALEHTLHLNQLAVGKNSTVSHRGQIADSNTIAPAGLQIDNFDQTSLDDYVEAQGVRTVNYIKMDVEGAEPDALAGAQNLIARFQPRLAISTYHKPDHFWELPLQIKKLNPNYKFAFGHHTQTIGESVIYAYT